jgi:glucokinase
MTAQPGKTILTLDAGGTNLVFFAMRDFKEITEPVKLPAHSDDLEKCIESIIAGFEVVAKAVGHFDAISFAFPGPADYEIGVIGDLPNFKAFNGDVPLGPILENYFKVPIFINNDGDLFASGLANAGYLQDLNKRLSDAGSKKQFHNLIGITLGTGFGSGIVCNGQLLTGDNSCAAEIHNTLNPFHSNWNAEESVSTRAIQRNYANFSRSELDEKLMPKSIAEIALGLTDGNQSAAKNAFQDYGKALGASIANVLTLIDGVVVLGGGLTASWNLFAPAMFEEVNREIEDAKGNKFKRLSFMVFDMEDETQIHLFLKGKNKKIQVPSTDKFIEYDELHRTTIAKSKMDASSVIALGAYAFALKKLGIKN